MTSSSTGPIKVFFSYTHEDETLRDELAKHLRQLEREGVIAGWHDRQISAGSEWAEQIDNNLEATRSRQKKPYICPKRKNCPRSSGRLRQAPPPPSKTG